MKESKPKNANITPEAAPAMTWSFQAVDTWFFRDGTPFQSGEGGRAGQSSGFPPPMTTLQGAIRTALALGQGWLPGEPTGSRPWPGGLGTPADLGELKLQGPYLRDGGNFLFPMPLHILGKPGDPGSPSRQKQFTRLVPGKEKIETDLGPVCLPEPRVPLPGARDLRGSWITREGLGLVLRGNLPQAQQVVPGEEMWQPEPRTGLEIDCQTRTAAQQKLYSLFHSRPKAGLEIIVRVQGVPLEWHQAVTPAIHLGGESRLACLEISDENKKPVLPGIPGLAPSGGKVNFTVTLVTPGCLYVSHGPGRYKEARDEMAEIMRQGYREVPGKCLSACLGKAAQLGGWDMVNKEPRPLLPVIPAGSTWFYQAAAGDLELIQSLHGRCLGPEDGLGFNQIIIGTWGDN